MLVVRRTLVPEEFLRSNEVSGLLHRLECDGLLKCSRLCVNLWHPILHCLPLVRASVEVAGDHALEIAWSCVTVRCVSEAEAGRATKVVVHVNLEVAGPASVALSPLNVLLADALTIVGITVWPVSKTALDHTFTRYGGQISCRGEVPVVGSALVALVPCHPWLAFALPIVPALEVCRTIRMAVAHDALLPSLGVLLRGGE